MTAVPKKNCFKFADRILDRGEARVKDSKYKGSQTFEEVEHDINHFMKDTDIINNN